MGGKIMINADCHNKDYLECSFGMAENLAKECGFTEYYVLTKDGMKAEKFN
jgi:histidinol-phosphatase (PHP family)